MEDYVIFLSDSHQGIARVHRKLCQHPSQYLLGDIMVLSLTNKRVENSKASYNIKMMKTLMPT